MTTAAISNANNKQSFIRQAVYDSYEDITTILDIKQLIDSFPCQVSGPSIPMECAPYNEVLISYVSRTSVVVLHL